MSRQEDNLEQPVSGLQSSVLDRGSARQNVLYVDRTVSIVQIVARRNTEAETVGT